MSHPVLVDSTYEYKSSSVGDAEYAEFERWFRDIGCNFRTLTKTGAWIVWHARAQQAHFAAKPEPSTPASEPVPVARIHQGENGPHLALYQEGFEGLLYAAARHATSSSGEREDAERFRWMAQHLMRDSSIRVGTEFKSCKAWAIASANPDLRAAVDAAKLRAFHTGSAKAKKHTAEASAAREAMLDAALSAQESAVDGAKAGETVNPPADQPYIACAECGKLASDGWALYCVRCIESTVGPALAALPATPIDGAK